MRQAVALLGLLLAGCTTSAGLVYAPPVAPATRGSPVISAVTVTDQRTETDPTYVGAIRGGFGNPLKTLTTARPITAEVQAAFEAGLRARNMLGTQGQDTLAVQVTKLSANQFVRREAQVAFVIALKDAAGQPVYSDTVSVDKVKGDLVTFDAGIFASIGDLRALVDQTLTEAVDDALDKPGLISAAH